MSGSGAIGQGGIGQLAIGVTPGGGGGGTATASAGFPSGTYNYGVPPNGPAIMELVLEAYERCGKIGIELTNQQIQSARRSLNLVLASWANKGPNLWTIAEYSQYMPQAVGEYVCGPEIIDIFPDSVMLRQYLMGAQASVVPQFITTAGSTEVVVFGLPATPAPGQYINVGVMVSVGGIILDGFYKVIASQGPGQALINAAQPAVTGNGGALWSVALWSQGLWATGDGTGNGVVPQFSTTAISPATVNPWTSDFDSSFGPATAPSTGGIVITVVLPNHSFLPGQTFPVEVATAVGGLNLLGPYPVGNVIDVDTFTIISPYPAGFYDTQFENGGKTLLSTQANNQGLTSAPYPVDLMLYPLSRGDWMAIPLKNTQGRPTSIWIDRQISPVVHVWPVPDANGPYELRFRASRQIQDADIMNGQSLAVPMRFLEAFVSSLAAQLAIKWAPDRMVALKTLSAEEWNLAATEDREKISTYIGGDLSQYFE